MNLKFKKNKIIRVIFFPIIIFRRYIISVKNSKVKYFDYFISNVTEGSIVMTLQNIPGFFEMDIRSHISKRILISKEYEPEIVKLVQNNVFADKDAINIGANVGLDACLLAGLINDGHKVLAVEPTPLAFKYLQRNIKRNNYENKIILFNGVCVNKPGKFYINSVIGKEEYSSLSENDYLTGLKEKITKYEVAGETVDNLIVKYNLIPGIILLDVEGAEMKVLEGAIETLREYKPIIIMELCDLFLSKQNTSSTKVIHFLKQLGYSIRSISNQAKLSYPFCGSIIAKP